MSMYCFRQFPEDKLDQLESIARKLNLSLRQKTNQNIYWDGYPNNDFPKSLLSISYHKNHDYELKVVTSARDFDDQTHINHANSILIRKTIKKLIDIANPEEIIASCELHQYDLREFY